MRSPIIQCISTMFPLKLFLAFQDVDIIIFRSIYGKVMVSKWKLKIMEVNNVQKKNLYHFEFHWLCPTFLIIKLDKRFDMSNINKCVFLIKQSILNHLPFWKPLASSASPIIRPQGFGFCGNCIATIHLWWKSHLLFKKRLLQSC